MIREAIEAQHPKTITAYADLMEEIKIRLQIVQSALRGGINLSPPFLQEFCYLQLRMIGELIALGCLLAHGDISVAKQSNLQGTWDADRIIKTLGSLHKDFFPYPVRRGLLPDGSVHLYDVEPGYLTKEDLLTLLGRADNKLHRGSLKNVLKNMRTVQNNFPDVNEWNNKIVRLLNEHRIMFADKRTLYYVSLMEANRNNQVTVHLAQAPEQ